VKRFYKKIISAANRKCKPFQLFFSAFLFSQISLGLSQTKKLLYQPFKIKSSSKTFPFNQISQILYFFNID